MAPKSLQNVVTPRFVHNYQELFYYFYGGFVSLGAKY